MTPKPWAMLPMFAAGRFCDLCFGRVNLGLMSGKMGINRGKTGILDRGDSAEGCSPL